MSWFRLSSGISLFYTAEGPESAPVMLFVHGWTCDSHDWSWQLAEFASMFRTVALDLRGHGRTDQPDSGYATAELAADVIELIEGLGLKDLIGVGHSMGAMVLSEVVIPRPELVRGLALVEPAYCAPDEAAARVRDMAELLRGPRWSEILTAQLEALEGPGTPAWMRLWHRRRLLGMRHDIAVSAYEEMLVTPQAWGTRTLSERRLAGRTCPTLSVYAAAHGDAAEWERGTSSAAAAQLIDGGHWLHQECPDETNRLILDWLAESCPAPKTAIIGPSASDASSRRLPRLFAGIAGSIDGRD